MINLSGKMSLDTFSRKQWRRMGYGVKKGSRYRWRQIWNGMHYIEYEAYGPDSIYPLRGEKAKKRRDEWFMLL